MKLQNTTKPTTIEPHTATTEKNSSFMRTQLSLYDKCVIMLHLHMKQSHRNSLLQPLTGFLLRMPQ